jgi:hypothetical protein
MKAAEKKGAELDFSRIRGNNIRETNHNVKRFTLWPEQSLRTANSRVESGSRWASKTCLWGTAFRRRPGQENELEELGKGGMRQSLYRASCVHGPKTAFRVRAAVIRAEAKTFQRGA